MAKHKKNIKRVLISYKDIDGFGERLKEMREKKNCSVKKVAEKTGIKYSTLLSYESGRSCPTKEETILKLAGFYKCTVDELFSKDADSFHLWYLGSKMKFVIINTEGYDTV